MTRSLAVLIVLTCACGHPAQAPPPDAVAPWLRGDPQRCLIPRDLSQGMETMARRCAEAFVRENGYTELPAEDSTRWAREDDDAGAWPRVLAARSGTLDAMATSVQCSRRECIVFFRVRRLKVLGTYRVEQTTQIFTQIDPAPGGAFDGRCGERRA
jgi:hypothetical protein